MGKIRNLKNLLNSFWAALHIHRKGSGGWLSEQVRSIMNETKRKKGPTPLKQKIQSLSLPNLKAIQVILLGLLFSIPLSWGLCLWDPRVLSLGNMDRVLSAYTTMWQVQAGIAAVALPILLFIIGLSKDDKQAAMRSHEVLIRETGVFPIIVFSLAGTFRIGLDIALFPKESVFLLDFILAFLGTIILAVFAYLSALKLLFSPARMKKRAMAVAKEKMDASLDASIEIRIANNLLFQKLAELKMGFWQFTPDRHEADQYLIVGIPTLGTLSDIHLGRLENFVHELSWKIPSKTHVITEPDPQAEEIGSITGSREREFVWVMKRYGEAVTKKHNGLIRLDKAAFDDLDANALEAQIGNFVRVSPTDEN